MLTRLVIIFISLIVTGCGSRVVKVEDFRSVHAYDGDEQPISELATVYGHVDFTSESVYIIEVDGISYFRPGIISSYPAIVYLTPGHHQISLLYRWLNTYAYSEPIDINVKKGETYAALATSSDKRVARFSFEHKGEGFILTGEDLMSWDRFKEENN